MDFLLKEFILPVITVSICYSLVFIAIVIDLWSGVRKAIKAGIVRTSHGFRKTVDKICKYYNCLLAVTIIDCFLMLLVYIFQHKGCFMFVPVFPVITLFVGLYIAFIEARSVFEKLEDKEKACVSADVNKLAEVLKDKDKLDKLLLILAKLK